MAIYSSLTAGHRKTKDFSSSFGSCVVGRSVPNFQTKKSHLNNCCFEIGFRFLSSILMSFYYYIFSLSIDKQLIRSML